MYMSDSLMRLGMLVWGGHLFVERQRRLALAAPLAEDLRGQHESKIRILAFNSAACTQCHTLQQIVTRYQILEHPTEHGQAVEAVAHLRASTQPGGRRSRGAFSGNGVEAAGFGGEAGGERSVLTQHAIHNADRSIGASLAGEIARRYGNVGLTQCKHHLDALDVPSRSSSGL